MLKCKEWEERNLKVRLLRNVHGVKVKQGKIIRKKHIQWKESFERLKLSLKKERMNGKKYVGRMKIEESEIIAKQV